MNVQRKKIKHLRIIAYDTHFGQFATVYYRSGTVNSKSFVGKVLLRIKWKFELINAL